MSFTDSIKTVFGKYAEFNGYASRSEYWWWFLFNVLVLSAFSIIQNSGGDGLGSSLRGVWSVFVLIPNLSVAVRRLRDAGYYWAHILWGIIPVVGQLILVILLAQSTKKS